MNDKLLVAASNIARRIVKRQSDTLLGFSFESAQLEAKGTSTEGIVVECGVLRRGRYSYGLQISEERYAQRDAHFWYGVQASSKTALRNLEDDLQLRGIQVGKPLTRWVIADKTKDHYRLAAPLLSIEWQSILPEYYPKDGEWFLGVYLATTSITAQLLGEMAARLWLDCSPRKPSALRMSVT